MEIVQQMRSTSGPAGTVGNDSKEATIARNHRISTDWYCSLPGRYSGASEALFSTISFEELAATNLEGAQMDNEGASWAASYAGFSASSE